MKNNILSNIQRGITAVTVASTAFYGSAEASTLTQNTVNAPTYSGMTAVFDTANGNLTDAYTTYYTTQAWGEANGLASDLTYAGNYSTNITLTDKNIDGFRSSDLVEVKTDMGTAEMRSYTVTNLNAFADVFIAGEANFGFTFGSKALYDQFLADVEQGIVLELTGISYIDPGTNITLSMSYTDSETGQTTTWGGGSFIIGTAIQDGGGKINALLVPEPSTATLSLLSLAGLLARRRRKTV